MEILRRSNYSVGMSTIDPGTTKVYDFWSKTYDHTFGRLVMRGHTEAVKHLRLTPGNRVLDIGIGTGMALTHYPKDVTVVGLDLSQGMLEIAARRCRRMNIDNAHLVLGDATCPPFAEQSFDNVVISHVITVVDDPGKLLHWAERMLKPGGRVVMVNHFRSDNGLISWFERVLNPMFKKLGWRSDLGLEDVLAQTDMQLAYRFKFRLFDLWQVVVMCQSDIAIEMPTPQTEKTTAVSASADLSPYKSGKFVPATDL